MFNTIIGACHGTQLGDIKQLLLTSWISGSMTSTTNPCFIANTFILVCWKVWSLLNKCSQQEYHTMLDYYYIHFSMLKSLIIIK